MSTTPAAKSGGSQGISAARPVQGTGQPVDAMRTGRVAAQYPSFSSLFPALVPSAAPIRPLFSSASAHIHQTLSYHLPAGAPVLSVGVGPVSTSSLPMFVVPTQPERSNDPPAPSPSEEPSPMVLESIVSGAAGAWKRSGSPMQEEEAHLKRVKQVVSGRRPTPAMILFMNQHRNGVQELSPASSAQQITARLREYWDTLPESGRAKFIAMEAEEQRQIEADATTASGTAYTSTAASVAASPVTLFPSAALSPSPFSQAPHHAPLAMSFTPTPAPALYGPPTASRPHSVARSPAGKGPATSSPLTVPASSASFASAARQAAAPRGLDDMEEVVVNGDRCVRVGAVFFRVHVPRPSRM